MTNISHYERLMCACYSDIVSAYPAQCKVEFARDLATIRGRVACEGESFLTKTLPSLVKAVDTALANNTTLQVPNFSRRKGSQLPRFLGWLIGRVFSADGRELDDSDPRALKHIRQFLLLYKLEKPSTPRQQTSVCEEFKSTDAGLLKLPVLVEPAHVRELRLAASLIGTVLRNADPRDILPGHGPGSVATGEAMDEKAYFRRSYRSVEAVYPLDEFYYMNPSHQSDRLTDKGLATLDLASGTLRPWEELDTGTAKVVLVPKDSRGPRLISMEPLEIQWIQQGQMRCLVRHIERNWYTRGHVNFERQDINQCLALFASASSSSVPKYLRDAATARVHTLPTCAQPRSSDLVTLDMKEASDRVSLSLVYALFPNNWVEALDATRSTRTVLPNGETITLNKFAPMGSAVCFPVEALCFWAIAVAAICTLHSARPAFARDRVWVYGDDIVCHREDYPAIQQSLERVGLKLNSSKCCTAGSFRESCGMDAYKGVQVTPLRIKKCVMSNPTGQNLSAYVAYSNAAYAAGYTNLAEELELLVQQRCRVPYTTRDSGAIQFVRPDADVRTLNRRWHVRTRFCRKLHVLTAYGPTPVAVVASKRPVTWETYFMRSLAKLVPDSSAPQTLITKSLLRLGGKRLKADQYSVPRRVTPKRGWKQITL